VDTIAKTIKKMILSFFTNWLEDFFIVAGVALLVINTYQLTIAPLNIIVGNYTLSAILVLAGVILAKK
jgi:hypothetical protein